MNKSKYKTSVSINDFPLFRSSEYLFARLKETGVDGIELVLGIKSRWNIQKIAKLSEKYSLPILSMHQPAWSIVGMAFDEGFIAQAHALDVKHITFHPPSRYSFSDPQMEQFLKRLQFIQKKYDMIVQLENMPRKIRLPLLKRLLPYHPDTTDPEKVFAAAQLYGLNLTLDISHAFTNEPHAQQWFTKIYPALTNVHSSSFTDKKDHPPLHLGNFDTQGFINDLKKRNYSGLITLEIYYPKKVSYRTFNFENIRKSVDIIRQ